MNSLTLVKLALCGPSDVAKEIEIAQKAIDDWNRLHSEVRGVTVRHQHWSTDTFPNATETGQGAINGQMFDESHIIVAVFWSRLGTPTATAPSGTVEEIRRGIAQKKKVLVYFSNLEPLPANADDSQVEKLWQFRQDLRATSSCWSFQSRSQFREEFTTHLALAMNELMPPPKRAPRKSTKISQKIEGNNNLQVVGDANEINQYQNPPVIKTVLERPPECITSAQEFQISEWIKELAEGTIGKPRDEAFREWGGFFLWQFKIPNRGLLPASEMGAAEEWYQKHRAIQKRGYKTKAPDQWRATRIKSIKTAMGQMGRTNEDYYPEITRRLKLKKPLESLKKLTKIDLDRVYSLVLGDARK